VVEHLFDFTPEELSSDPDLFDRVIPKWYKDKREVIEPGWTKNLKSKIKLFALKPEKMNLIPDNIKF